MTLAEARMQIAARERGKPNGLKNKHWPERAIVRHNGGDPIVLGRKAFKLARLARKKSRAKARLASRQQ